MLYHSTEIAFFVLQAFQQDIFPHQQILYSIISDGHEMMENSRGTSGAEDFGRKLQLLEEQWQTIVRQANQRKALVDSIVTLWQTYREMTDELSTTVGRVRRFVDSHRVVPETFSSVRHHLDNYTVRTMLYSLSSRESVADSEGKSGHGLPIQCDYRLWPPSNEEVNVRYWETY